MLATLALLPALRPSPSSFPVAEGVPDHLVSDRPIETAELDTLQRRTIADTVARFLRNESTEPPMTIAITGNWGEGKSSLMNLVKADLNKYGTRTVWFNAWHHQKEQHLFAALLQAVRNQAVPSWVSLRGIPFRWRLFWSRIRLHWKWALPMFFPIGILISMPDILNVPVPDHTQIKIPQGSAEFEETINFLKSTYSYIVSLFLYIASRIVNELGLILLALFIIGEVTAKLKRSGIDAGRLLATVSGAFRVKAFGDQLGFRYRFGEAFEEVAEALPKPLLILVDDLDRCRPEQVVEVLEAINFLVNAGRCYVVMGIAPEQVMYCVGLGFKEIAAEMAEAPGNDKSPEEWAREKRRDYARNYLEKLINIEVPIPMLTDEDANRIAEPVRSNGSPSESRRAFWHFARLLATIAGLLVVLGVGIYVGDRMHQNTTATLEQGRLSTALPPPPALPRGSPSVPPNVPALQPPAPNGNGNGPFRPGAEDVVPLWVQLLTALLAVTLAGATAIFAWRWQTYRIEDSPTFRKARETWLPLALAKRNTARQVKRFTNQVRYLAMALGVSTTPPSGAKGQQPSESLIVALAALQGMGRDLVAGNREQPLPLELARLLETSSSNPNDVAEVINDWLDKVLEGKGNTQIQERIRETFFEHRINFPHETVTEEILSQFHKMASGIVVR